MSEIIIRFSEESDVEPHEITVESSVADTQIVMDSLGLFVRQLTITVPE